MAINGSGVRDTVRVLKVGINTGVIRILKNLALKTINHSIGTTEVVIAPEIDEQWSYVQNKAKQRWLWYALDMISLKVVAYTFGTRCDKTLELLLKKLENFKVTFYFTDGCGSYARLLNSKKHIVIRDILSG
jgi:insertion element IS1 protein InsB